MKRFVEMALILLITVASTNCFAACNCDDWVKRGGYCVDYIKARIPIFPIPQNVAAIRTLKNRDVKDVEKGDVAIFNLGTFWHVAYVEKVHLDRHGNATAVDVSEMNFGGTMSIEDLKKQWGMNTESEWKRAVCCGVTRTYDRITSRENIELGSIQQIWSPDHFAFHNFKSSAGFSIL
jgi:hypothetical protein